MYTLWIIFPLELVGGGVFRGHTIFEKVISISNLFRAWREFKRDKIKKQDVAEFSVNVEENLFALQTSLSSGAYSHSSYESFYVCDPKRRHIHKASVRDRLLHHAIFRIVEPMYNKSFIFDSYSSRKEKGTHKACGRFRKFAWKLSQNNTKNVWILKCDIKKFFDSVDHKILLSILSKKIKDKRLMDLFTEIISSFKVEEGKGIPLGNLTSQLFSNIYLDSFDHYVKRVLRIKHYIRYADDFVIFNTNKEVLIDLLPLLHTFLRKELILSLHPNKVSISKFSQGVDFLGYVIFPYHQILRTKTKNRILKKVKKLVVDFNQGVVSEKSFNQSLASYLGVLKHCRGRKIQGKIEKYVKP